MRGKIKILSTNVGKKRFAKRFMTYYNGFRLFINKIYHNIINKGKLKKLLNV